MSGPQETDRDPWLYLPPAALNPAPLAGLGGSGPEGRGFGRGSELVGGLCLGHPEAEKPPQALAGLPVWVTKGQEVEMSKAPTMWPPKPACPPGAMATPLLPARGQGSTPATLLDLKRDLRAFGDCWTWGRLTVEPKEFSLGRGSALDPQGATG